MKVLIPYCGVGGTAWGWYLAGWDVVGVDIEPQPDYPKEMGFVQGDAIEAIHDMARDFDFVDAAPPCQFSSALSQGTNKGRVYPNMIPPTRIALRKMGVPYLIENVAGAKLRKDFRLCGTMFRLRMFRHRFYEGEGIPEIKPVHVTHIDRVAGWRHGEYHEGNMFAIYGDGGGKGSVSEWREAMGID